MTGSPTEKPTSFDLNSDDVAARKRADLKRLFPEVFDEDKIDFDQLRRVMGDWVDEGTERFGLTWPGKAACMKVIQAPATGALRPDRSASVNFDESENIFIEGDNLEVLKLLQKSYFGKIKLIYIDPPYNTGTEFIYPDNYSENLETYLAYSGQADEEGNRFSTDTETTGRFHSRWLNMMMPRLNLARNLLRDDGLMAIHIDENEIANLLILMNGLFGEENNLGTVVWDKRNPKGKVAGVAQQHEYIVFFSKNIETFGKADYFYRKKANGSKMLMKASDLIAKHSGVNAESRDAFRKWANDPKNDLSGGEKAYSQIDDNGEVYRLVSMAAPDKPETRSHRPLIHPKTGKPCPTPEKGWRFPNDSMDRLLAKGEVVFGIDETTQPQRKYLLKNNLKEAVPSLLYHGGSDTAFDLGFDNPKPVAVAARVIEAVCQGGDIIMDFFAGSSTSAHAAMKVALEEGRDLRFIMVQLPEPIESKKSKFATIADLSRERIRRAIQEFQGSDGADLGFRSFKLRVGFETHADRAKRRSMSMAAAA